MITFGYDCPHCGVKNSGFEVKSHYECQKNNDYSVFSLLAVCNTCSNAIVGTFDENNYLGDIAQTRALLDSETKYNLLELTQGQNKIVFYPNAQSPEIPAHLPDSVEDKIRAAEKLFISAKGDSDMLEYAGTAYRKAIEVALSLLDDNSDKNLNWRINHLVKERVLVKSMGDFAHRIRSLGNDATHDQISLEELTQLRLFTSLFLQYTFTLPAMILDELKSE